jgi:hypothetical protein
LRVRNFLPLREITLLVNKNLQQLCTPCEPGGVT